MHAATITNISLLLTGLIYGLFICWCALGWLRAIRSTPAGRFKRGASISVIVPARNEERTVVDCVRSILSSHDGSADFEVIVVNDGSTDQTAALVAREFEGEIIAGRVKLVHLEDGEHTQSGKQRALDSGIAVAQGTYLLTTDADCVVGSSWVVSLCSVLESGASVVAGPVRLKPARSSVFERLQALEVIGLSAVAGGAITNGYPTICNSANLAYTRDAFSAWAELMRQRGERPASPGVDETILLDAPRLTGAPAAFVADPDATVTAKPAADLLGFFRQRVRWAAMGGQYPQLGLKLLSVCIFVFFVLLLAAPSFAPAPILVTAILLKIVPDLLLLFVSVPKTQRRKLLSVFLIGEVLHAPYIVAVATWGALAPVRWKGR